MVGVGEKVIGVGGGRGVVVEDEVEVAVDGVSVYNRTSLFNRYNFYNIQFASFTKNSVILHRLKREKSVKKGNTLNSGCISQYRER